MPRYAEWQEYKRAGRHGRVIKQIYHVKKRILDENETMYLVEDDEQSVWVNKTSVNVTEE